MTREGLQLIQARKLDRGLGSLELLVWLQEEVPGSATSPISIDDIGLSRFPRSGEQGTILIWLRLSLLGP